MNTIRSACSNLLNRSVCLLVACFLLAAIVPSVSAQNAPSHNLSGVWSGTDLSGDLISYAFDADGTAAIYKNRESVLEGGETSSVVWTFRDGTRFGELDIVYSDDYGTNVTTRYLVRWESIDTIVLRSGGKSGARPGSTGTGGGAMRIRLSR